MSENAERRLVTVLNWSRMDPEEWIGFRGGKYTDPNPLLTFLLGAFLAAGFMGVTYCFRHTGFAVIFFERGFTPYFIVPFSTWALAILFFKGRKLALQRKALDLMVVPHERDFVLSPATAPMVLDRMCALVDNPRHFALLNRIERALSNLKNIGVISDVSEMLRAQAENDEDHMESSYSMVKGLIWGIPVLGFIGTVVGLSQAIGGFGSVMMSSGSTIENLKESLHGVTQGLATAFDTTFIGLVAALAIELTTRAIKKKEENFLDDCKEYCHANIVSKLRLIRVEGESAKADPTAVADSTRAV